MPSDKADYSVEIVTDNGQADATVVVVDGISNLSPVAGDSLFFDGTNWVDRPIADGDIPAAIARDSEVAAVESLTLISAANQSMDTTLTAVGGTRFRLAAADWNLLAGKTPQYRLVAVWQAAFNAGDVMEADLLDADASAVFVAATVTVPAVPNSNTVVIAKSAWTAFSGSKFGYARARNQTGSRGGLESLTIQIRYV